MKVPTSDLPNYAGFLGFNAQGNFGPFTIYVNKHRKPVWYLTTPQQEPPSYGRQHQKARLAAAAFLWQSLTPATRAAWGLAARRCNLRISGYNLWVWYCMRMDPGPIQTIERLSGLQLLTVP